MLPRKKVLERRPVLHAVDDVSLTVSRGQTLSIVGESGSGKTTLGKVVLGLELPTSGKVIFDGEDVTRERRWRGPSPMQAVFQDPYGSFNPRMRIKRILSEPLLGGGRTDEADSRIDTTLALVGIDPSSSRNFPHEFSGGQRQRIAVARALISEPSLVVLDEPVSALDVSIRAQIINLLKRLQSESEVAYLMIAHDLATVKSLSHRVAAMYLGVVVEHAATSQLFMEPLHPYTKALLSASLPLKPSARRIPVRLKGEPPSPLSPPSGCRFRTRCPVAFDRCAVEVPKLQEVGSGHQVACHLY